MSFDLQLTNGDLTIGSDGTIDTVVDNLKLSQDIVKILTTPLGSNRFNPWYGSDLGYNTIGQTLPPDALVSDISNSVQNALTILQTLQQAQATNQQLSLGEQLSMITNIQVQKYYADPRQLMVSVTVQTKRITQNITEIFVMDS